VVGVTVVDGQTQVDRVFAAVDAVSPDGLSAQIESGIIYGLTSALIGMTSGNVPASFATCALLRQKALTGTIGGSIEPRRHLPEFVDL
jgi:CO/xanthine dehydrogenase Mo-binding subunit